MNVSLTPELERFIQDKVNAGLYNSASEVIRESLRLLNTHDALQQQRIAQLNQAIDVGINQLRQGQRIEGKVSYEKMKRKIDKITTKGK